MSETELAAAETAAQRMISEFLEMHNVCGVRIFFTMKVGPSIAARHYGNGDFYSIKGWIHDWLTIQDERARIETQRQEKPEEEI